MTFFRVSIIMAILAAGLIAEESGHACTNLLVTTGASVDGSVMITYTCDGEFHPILERTPARDWPAGDSVAIMDWHDSVRGYIPQVPRTYAVVGMMNEHQLAISETTFDGRLELQNKQGLLHYWDLIDLALKRAKTAREAIVVMTDLVEKYGYRSTGESFSIADTKEVWIMEMIGPGPDIKGAVWVALRVPDGYICAHANKARIGEFPLNDSENCLYSPNVITLAVENGFYNPGSGAPFRYCEAYCPQTPSNQRYADGRVWSIFRRAAPNLNLSPDYHRAVAEASPYPLWIKPDKKLSLSDVFALMRDHYEGTPYDMTLGIDAGPFGSPYRWRPMDWTVDSVKYAWERPVSTQQTGFSFVSQSRNWLPDKIGGVFWYGVDDTYTTCYFPLYCGIEDIPVSFATGGLEEFSWDSAWWIFNLAANYANLKYSYMIQDILPVQKDLEQGFISVQPTMEKTATELWKSDSVAAIKYLTGYSVMAGEKVMDRWQKLTAFLIAKYNDGYVRHEKGEPQGVGYPENWLREVLKSRPEQFRLPVKEEDAPESRLID